LENALLRREIDIAAHSLKDLPSRLPEGLALGAVPVREDPRDVLITHGGRNLQTLPIGAVISTGSERRRIQLAAMRPDIRFRDIRGNIETRILKVGSEGVDGVVLAYAGLKRLGIESRAEQVFSSEEMLPAPCQGALGAECRAEDKHALDLLRGIENYKIRACVDIERAFIAELGLGCHAPVAALAVFESGNICFEGLAGGRGGEIFRSRFSVPADRADEAALAMAAEMKKQMEI